MNYLLPLAVLFYFSASSFAETKKENSKTEAQKIEKAKTADAKLRSRLGQAALAEQMENARILQYKKLPGGVFNAPEIRNSVVEMFRRFQATKMVNSDAVFNIFLASTPEINAWISSELTIKDLKVYNVVCTYGLLDLLSKLPNSKALLAAVYAHEVGHAMMGHTGDLKATTRIYNEFDADEFAVKLLHAAGYDPESMIFVLQEFEKMNTNKELRALIAKMLDVHPKPTFRIAHIAELTALLKQDREARKEMNFPPMGIPSLPVSELNRKGKEVISRGSSQAIIKALQLPVYLNLPLQKKLKYLEEDILKGKIGSDQRIGLVKLMAEYQRLSEQAGNFDDLQRVIDSFRRFVEKIGVIAKITSDEVEENVRLAVSETRLKMTDLSEKFQLQKNPEGMTAENLQEWGSKLDGRYIFGELIQKSLAAKSLQEIKQIIEMVVDRDGQFHDRFRFNSGTVGGLQEHFFAKLAIQVLSLTKDLGKTLEFIQEEFPYRLEESKKKFTIGHKMIAEFIHYVLTHDGIYLDSFNEKMSHSTKAKDRDLRHSLLLWKNRTSTALFKLRGLDPYGSPLSADFNYGAGRKYHLKRPITPSQIYFLHITLAENGGLSSQTIQKIFVDLIKTHYSVDEILELLAEKNPRHADFWKNFRNTLASPITNNYSDLTSQVNLLLEKLPLFTEYRSIYIAELTSLKAQARSIYKENLISIFRSYAQTNYIRMADGSHMLPQLPDISSRVIERLNNEERTELFEAIVRSQVEIDIRYFAPILKSKAKIIVDGIRFIQKESRITEAAADEYLQVLQKFIDMSEKFATDPNEKLSSEYFVLRRQLQMMTEFLTTSRSKLLDQLTEETKTALASMIDLYQKKFTSADRGTSLINSFLIPTESETISYLEGDGAKPPWMIELTLGLTKIISKYQGATDLENIKSDSPTEFLVGLTKNIYAPRNTTTTSIVYGELMTFEEKMALLPFGKGFQAELLEESRLFGSKTENDLFTKTLTDLWSFQLQRAAVSSDPIEALIHTLSYIKGNPSNGNEELARTHYIFLKRAVSLVKNEMDAQAFTSLLAIYLEKNGITASGLTELLSADPKAFTKVAAAKYREHFFDSLCKKIDQFNAWSGLRDTFISSKSKFFEKMMIGLHRQISNFFEPTHTGSKYKPQFLFYLVKKMMKFCFGKKDWYNNFLRNIQQKISVQYTRVLARRDINAGSIGTEDFLKKLRENTPWSVELDLVIAEHIREGKFKTFWPSSKKLRTIALDLCKTIRSLTIRDETYRYILKEYGDPSNSYWQHAKNLWALYKAYREAEAIWTDEVIEELKNVTTDLDRFKTIEQAWDDHVSKRASAKGVTRDAAILLLLNLHGAVQNSESPFGGEVAAVFPEASRYRDPLLEEYTKKKEHTPEELKFFDRFKARKTESPYHGMIKVLFEGMDEYVTRMTALERAEFAFYLAGLDKELRPELAEKIKDRFQGSTNRRKAIRRHGYYLNFKDIRTFFQETHPEERLVAYRALFIGGVGKDPVAVQLLIDRLLLADKTMPVFLRKSLNIYLNSLDSVERDTLLAWLLANSKKEILRGPEIVKLLVEKGGVAAAKLAQLVASHGFKLSSDYQVVLEKFKSQAQTVDKIVAMQWISERLPKEKYDQIKKIDRELGSGSLKIGYLATLKDGKKVVIMLSREYVIAKTAREFKVLRTVISEMMKDPELAIGNLPSLEAEVERIIKAEMNFNHEAEMMRLHKVAYAERPILVRMLGNIVDVFIPQAIPGWAAEDILVEEYASATNFLKLPKGARPFGWNQESLSKAAINEVVAQLLSYLSAKKVPNGKVVLDIDPHEENQLAQKGLFGVRRAMVNIDLGQTVQVDPKVVEVFAAGILKLWQKDFDAATNIFKNLMIVENEKDFQRLRSELQKQSQSNTDVVEALTKAMEEVELEGIMLKPEYLFFQKLFATLVGLKRHVADPNYITKQIMKVLGLHALSDPSGAIKAYRGIQAISESKPAFEAQLCSQLYAK